MPWRRRTKPAQKKTARLRPDRHGRHGRVDRSSVLRPPLAPLETRRDRFDLYVGTVAEFLQSAWPELRDVRFEIVDLPPLDDTETMPRWHVSSEEKRIVLFRVPIERLTPMPRGDELYTRMMIESFVFQATGEYLNRDPWDLGPERFRGH